MSVVSICLRSPVRRQTQEPVAEVGVPLSLLIPLVGMKQLLAGSVIVDTFLVALSSPEVWQGKGEVSQALEPDRPSQNPAPTRTSSVTWVRLQPLKMLQCLHLKNGDDDMGFSPLGWRSVRAKRALRTTCSKTSQ